MINDVGSFRPKTKMLEVRLSITPSPLFCFCQTPSPSIARIKKKAALGYTTSAVCTVLVCNLTSGLFSIFFNSLRCMFFRIKIFSYYLLWVSYYKREIYKFYYNKIIIIYIDLLILFLYFCVITKEFDYIYILWVNTSCLIYVPFAFKWRAK